MKFIKDFITFLNEGVRLSDAPRKDKEGKTVYPGLVSIRPENDPNNPNELKTIPRGAIKTSKGSKIKVIYAFESEDGSSKNRIKIKDTMDALKNGGVLGKDIDELEEIVSSVIRTQIGSFKNIDTIVKVGSRSPLVEILTAIIYKNNPNVEIAWLQKKKYESVEDALDEVMVAALAEKDPIGSTKKKLDAYRSSRRDVTPFYITKSGDMPASIRQYFKDKYDFSRTMEKKSSPLNRFGAPAETISFSDACIKTLYNLQEKKVTLVIDDNIHGGDDMTEIAEAMKKVANQWTVTMLDSIKKPEGELSNTKRKKFEAELEKGRELDKKYREVYASSLDLMTKYLVGLVTYKIKDDDLPKRGEKEMPEDETQLPLGVKRFADQPTRMPQEKKIKRVTPKVVVDVFNAFEKAKSADGNNKEQAVTDAFHKTLREIETDDNLKLKIREEEREIAGERERTRGISVTQFVNTNARFVNDELKKQEEKLRATLGKNVIVPRINPDFHIKKIMATRSLES